MAGRLRRFWPEGFAVLPLRTGRRRMCGARPACRSAPHGWKGQARRRGRRASPPPRRWEGKDEGKAPSAGMASAEGKEAKALPAGGGAEARAERARSDACLGASLLHAPTERGNATAMPAIFQTSALVPFACARDWSTTPPVSHATAGVQGVTEPHGRLYLVPCVPHGRWPEALLAPWRRGAWSCGRSCRRPCTAGRPRRRRPP